MIKLLFAISVLLSVPVFGQGYYYARPAAAAGGLVLYTTNKANATSGTTAMSHNVTCPASSQLVITACSERTGANNSFTVAGGGLTWTKRSESTLSAAGDVEVWEAWFSAGGAITVTVTPSASGLHRSSVLWVVTGAETTWGGAAPNSAGTAQALPQVSATSTRANSFFIGATSDFNAVGGSADYEDTPAHTEIYVDPNGSNYRAWHYYVPVTTATTYTLGMDNPGSQAAGTAFIEIRTP